MAVTLPNLGTGVSWNWYSQRASGADRTEHRFHS